jgi:salicylate hydroxylase
MAVEDGAVIGTLLGLYYRHRQQNTPGSPSSHEPTIPQTLALYEKLQKARTTTLTLGSISNQHLYHLADGPEQEERDKIFKETKWEERPEGEEEKFIWIDVRYQMAVVGRDAIGEAGRAWEHAWGDNGGGVEGDL